MPASPRLSCLALLLSGTLGACQSAGQPAPPAAGPVLSGTAWELVELRPGNAAEPLLQPTAPERYRISFGVDGRLGARFDCNQGGGNWTSTGGTGLAGSLDLGPLISTKMFCGEDSLGDRFAQALETVGSYTLKGPELVLGPTPDGGLLVFRRAAAAP